MTAIHDADDLRRLLEAARAFAPDYGGDDAALHAVSENATFRIERRGQPTAVLRFYRPGGRSAGEIAGEIAWIEALRADAVLSTPAPLAGPGGTTIRRAEEVGRLAVAFGWVDGRAPIADAQCFRALGSATARLHAHARRWSLPPGCERPLVDDATTAWGEWRAVRGIGASDRGVIERAMARADAVLARSDPAWHGLIHTDLRVANMLQGADGALTVLDFDDCAIGPFATDFAGSTSFLEHDAAFPALARAWCDGYAAAGGAIDGMEAALGAAVLRRRVRLTAWIESHAEAPLARAMAPGFADGTVAVAREFLRGTAPRPARSLPPRDPPS